MKFASLAVVAAQLSMAHGLSVATMDDTSIDEEVFFPAPVQPISTSCSCFSDYDCQQSKYCGGPTCVFSKYTRTGTCQSIKPPTKAPTKTPTRKPTRPPTRAPIKPTLTGNCLCKSDYECIQSPYCPDKCVISPYTGQGQCQNVGPTPTPPTPTPPTPTPPPMDKTCCDVARSIPTECEVRLLIEIMETAVGINFAILPQWVRLSFHDAGTFNKILGHGGANGCLMTHPLMRTMDENHSLDLALETLATIKGLWEGHPDTCLLVSAADMIQFAGWFAVLRQKGAPGLTTAKKDEIVAKTHWGRPDEANCQTSWTQNLPGFKMGSGQPILERCTRAGGEIKDKMMDRNGFTAMEATALMGAHTIGMTRNEFGSGPGSLAGTWTFTGRDNATPQGPIFDFSYHRYLKLDIEEDTAQAFQFNILAFDVPFPDWFRESGRKINHLDTDVTLAFPSVNLSVYPDFHTFTAMFANSNHDFLKHFEAAFRKMSALGVTVPLVLALPCSVGCVESTTPVLSEAIESVVLRDVEAAVDNAEFQLAVTEDERAVEIQDLTSPIDLAMAVDVVNDSDSFLH